MHLLTICLYLTIVSITTPFIKYLRQLNQEFPNFRGLFFILTHSTLTARHKRFAKIAKAAILLSAHLAGSRNIKGFQIFWETLFYYRLTVSVEKTTPVLYF